MKARSLFVLLFLSGCALMAQAFGQGQAGPGYMDPQRVVSANLNVACAGGSGCPTGSTVTQTLASGLSVCSVTVTGTFSATIQFEESSDGANWYAFNLTPNGAGIPVTSTTSAFTGASEAAGYTYVRARMSAYVSGAAATSLYCVPEKAISSAYQSSGGLGTRVTIVSPTSGGNVSVVEPLPSATYLTNSTIVNTPAVNVQNTPAVTVFNTPGVTVQNTPAVAIATPLCNSSSAVCTFSLNSPLPTISPEGVPIFAIDAGGFATPVPAATAGPPAVKNSAGRLVALLVTVVGTTGVFTCYDNASAASGTVIGAISATNGAILGYYVKVDMPAANGIFCVSAANGPAVTVSYL